MKIDTRLQTERNKPLNKEINQMNKKQTFQQIKTLWLQGLSLAEIKEKLKIEFHPDGQKIYNTLNPHPYIINELLIIKPI